MPRLPPGREAQLSANRRHKAVRDKAALSSDSLPQDKPVPRQVNLYPARLDRAAPRRVNPDMGQQLETTR
jgi:hypothetical protein